MAVLDPSGYTDTAFENLLNTEIKNSIKNSSNITVSGKFSIGDPDTNIMIDVRSPNSVQVTDNLITRSWEGTDGVFHEVLIRRRKKVNWIYKVISYEDAYNIYENIIMYIMYKNKNRYFYINSPYIGKEITKDDGLFYLGTPCEPQSVYGENGKIEYWSLEWHWIQKVGHKFNNPV
jgi:hypothetical protein